MANFFQRFFGGKPAVTQSVKAAPGGPGFRFIGGGLVPYDTRKLTFIDKGYAANDMLFSVIKLITKKARQAPMALYTIQDERKFFEYTKMIGALGEGTQLSAKDMIKLKDLRLKALKLDTSDTYMNERLQNPNDTNQTMADLNEALFAFKLVTGDYYEAGWSPLTGGFNRGKPSQFYELPSQYMSIVSTRTLPLIEQSYELMLGGRQTFDADDVLHEKYVNLQWDTAGNQLYGMSPIQAALARLQASNEGIKRQGKAMKNAGADVAVYQDDPETTRQFPDYSIEQMGASKERWEAEQWGSENAGKAIWSPTKLGVARLGLSPVDLAQLPAELANLRWFCNLYDVPSQLMNDPENKIYSNQVEGQKALLYNAVLPLLVSRQQNFNKKLRRMDAYRGTNKVVEFDLSIYKELESNKQELVGWLKDSRFNMETFYKYMDQEIPADMPEEVRKAILIPTGYQLIDDLFMSQQDQGALTQQLNNSGDNPYNLPVS